jgi:hypothetical protein
MRFKELTLELALHEFLLTVVLNLVGEVAEVVEVVLLSHFEVVVGYNVLLFLLPVELLAFELPVFLYFFTLRLESLLCLLGDLSHVVCKYLSFVLMVVVNFERTLGTHKVGVKRLVIAYMFALKGKTNQVL